MRCQQEGEVWACFSMLHVFRRFPSGFKLILSLCSSQFFTCDHQLNRWSCALVWPLQSTGLTGQSKAEAAALFCDVVCMYSFGGSCIGSGRACMCAGGALCGFRDLVWWFVLFAWPWFCLRCVDSLPLKDRNGEPERGGEWEPIKILLKNSAMNAKLLEHLRKLLLPNPRSHWSATGPRRKVQPTAAQNTQRKTTRNCCWQPKPVRPASWDLAIHMQGKPVRPIWQTGQAGFDQEILKRPSRPKQPKTPQDAHNLWTRKAIPWVRLSCSKKLLSTAH
jgi:hypothetical protein